MSPVIRFAVPEDAQAINAIYAPLVRETAISFELEPPSPEELRARIWQTLATHPWLVWEEGGAILGYAYAGAHRQRPAYRWSADVTLYVAAHVQRRGIGRALYQALFEVLRLQGIHNLFAGIALPNPASVGLHEALGFLPVGVYRAVGFKQGAWHDVGWWQRPLAEPCAAPPEPRALAELRDEPALVALWRGGRAATAQ